MKRMLGTCYYPEHWSPSLWKEDARRMVEVGLSWVRIGEFAWSRLEPTPRQYQFDWMDETIEVLGQAGLKVVFGTPTATPPRWMIDRYPDMLAVDLEGRVRKFGSRRHYCFSHEGYKSECAIIVEQLAKHYGANPYVAAWQTDNEYGCHNTTTSYSPASRDAFQKWLLDRYRDIDTLNAAWGNVFWSMEYSDFDQIDLPNLTVTEANPAHQLAFRRFSSDQVVAFNRLQVDILRRHTQVPLTHNFMGRVTDFDHYKLGEDLDIASWDSYPLGFLEDRVGAEASHQKQFARQGDPDFQAFHHDLYRAVGKGRWWVMEQQPGPVNWAPFNPDPLPGMLRLWTWEAFAHGAETVCYFRWRQAPMAQEQMHAGLLRTDSGEAPALKEVREMAKDIALASDVPLGQSDVGLMFDYDADAMWHIQPHGAGISYFDLVFEAYKALRALGLSIDILPPTIRNFDGYKVVLVHGVMHMPADLKDALSKAEAQVIIGPRAAARDADMTIPLPLPPDLKGFDVKVVRVESLRLDMPLPLDQGGVALKYREILEGSAFVVLHAEDQSPVAMRHENMTYLGAWLDQVGFRRLFKNVCQLANCETIDLPQGVRTRRIEGEKFWFNYDTVSHKIGGKDFPPISVTREALKG